MYLKILKSTMTLLLIAFGLELILQSCAKRSNVGHFGYYMEYEEDTPELRQKVQELKDVMRRENQACTVYPGEIT